MDNIQLFTNELFGNVRSVLDSNGNPWFIGSDVAKCLGYIDTNQAIRDHVFNKNKYLAKPVELTGLEIGPRGAYLINEAGLYQLIFTSKLPAAESFQDWVTSEVLPTMRKLGFNNSLQMLQQELNRVTMERDKAIHDVGEVSLLNSFNKAERRYLECAIINDPNLSEDHKVYLFKYDPTELNPEYDIEGLVNQFKNLYGLL